MKIQFVWDITTFGSEIFRKERSTIIFIFRINSPRMVDSMTLNFKALMFIGPCIIAIVDERKTNLMSLAILFHLLCAQHVSDINISIIRSLRLC